PSLRLAFGRIIGNIDTVLFIGYVDQAGSHGSPWTIGYLGTALAHADAPCSITQQSNRLAPFVPPDIDTWLVDKRAIRHLQICRFRRFQDGYIRGGSRSFPNPLW